jgi:hypothetical protein
MLKHVYDLKSQVEIFLEMDAEIFKVENIIRQCKWNKTVTNKKCNSLSVSNRICNNLIIGTSLINNRYSIVDFFTLQMCSAKHVDLSGHIASEIR